MIEIKEAARSAASFVHELFNGEIRNLRLEEVELSEDERYWEITLGWQVAETEVADLPNSLRTMFGVPRTFKRFRVDVETGQVHSMKIREV